MALTDGIVPNDIVQVTLTYFRCFLTGNDEYHSWFYGAETVTSANIPTKVC